MCSYALVASLAFVFLVASAAADGPNVGVSLLQKNTSMFQKKVQKTPESAVADSAEPKAIFTIPLTKQLVPVKRNNRVISHKSAYFGSIHLGAPHPQEFSVVFDTGSGQVIIPAEKCQSPSCLIHRRYDTNKSGTGFDVDIDGTRVQKDQPRDSVDIGFGKGEVTGEFAIENVCLGPKGDNVSASKCIKGMKVVMAVQMSEEPFHAFSFDGVVGLGLSALSLDSSFNFFGMLASESFLPAPQIGLFLADSDTDPSEMAVGGHNPARLQSSLQWAPVFQPELGYWQIKIKGIKVDGKPNPLCEAGDCIAIVDSGTSHFGLPESLMSEFQDSLSSWHSGNESVDCRDQKGPEVDVDLEGFSMTLRTQDYARRIPFPYNNPLSAHTSVCRPRIMRVALPPPMGKKMFILGEPVLRRYYTVFDWGEKKVGFGLANQEPEDLVIMIQLPRRMRLNLNKRAPSADVKVTFGEKTVGLAPVPAEDHAKDLVMMLQLTKRVHLTNGKQGLELLWS